MALPTVFQPVRPQDFTITPITVHKRYVIQRSDLYSGSLPVTSSGYKVWTAIHTNERLKLGTPSQNNYPTNSFDGTYQHIIWKSIDAQYYRFPHDSYATLEHSNERFTYKFLNYSASIIVCPQQDFGEGILAGSVEITSSLGYNLTDDENGNLYDPSINTGSFTDRHNLVAWWNANNEYRNFKYNDDPSATLLINESGNFPYRSRTFSPSEVSKIKNVGFTALEVYTVTGSQILGKSKWIDLNLADSSVSSYVLTDDRPEFNFTSDFTIAFWQFASDNQNSTGSLLPIISKNGVIRKETFGSGKVYKETVAIDSNSVYSQSYFDEPTNVYPFDFSVMTSGSNYGKLRFRRSDGINTVMLTTTSSITDAPKHIAITKSGSLCTMYLNGVSVGTATDSTTNPVNKHSMMFGARNRQQQDYCSCMLNDVRFYDRAFSAATIQTLAASGSMSTLQTAVAGNVFYRKGTIVVSSHDPKYNSIFNYDFTLKYRNTHTIYQWETIVRIPKGSFNVSQNPTALQNPYTDLLKNEFTGSNPNSDLFPYITSIGLYNDQKELMAVAKLSQPLKVRNDVDVNISVRFDT